MGAQRHRGVQYLPVLRVVQFHSDPALGDQDRLERLQDLQRNLTLTHHRSRVGAKVEVLVDGTSRKGRNELRGRDRHHRLVNLRTGNRTSDSAPQKGELVQVDVIEATPHSLIGEISEAETGLEVVSRSA